MPAPSRERSLVREPLPVVVVGLVADAVCDQVVDRGVVPADLPQDLACVLADERRRSEDARGSLGETDELTELTEVAA